MNKIDRDRKLYGNCQVLSPEGILMFRCEEKKANWYLKRNLATVVGESPLTVQLNFKPRGIGNHGKEFGLTEMENRCVNCGTEEYLTRHHVVPFCYRRYFPLEIKSHNFHDVLSMCRDCHDGYERKADELKKVLSEKFSVSMHGIVTKNRIGSGEELTSKIIKSATTLVRDTTGIPKMRIDELNKTIRDFLGRDFTHSDLETISKMKEYVCQTTQGKVVMEHCDDIQEFVEMWRSHFLENNECRFLPKDWNVKNRNS